MLISWVERIPKQAGSKAKPLQTYRFSSTIYAETCFHPLGGTAIWVWEHLLRPGLLKIFVTSSHSSIVLRGESGQRTLWGQSRYVRSKFLTSKKKRSPVTGQILLLDHDFGTADLSIDALKWEFEKGICHRRGFRKKMWKHWGPISKPRDLFDVLRVNQPIGGRGAA